MVRSTIGTSCIIYAKSGSVLWNRGKCISNDILMSNIKIITITKRLGFYYMMSRSGKVNSILKIGQLYSKH
jgi:hypothetical protein